MAKAVKKNPDRVREQYTKEFGVEAVRLLKRARNRRPNWRWSWAFDAINSTTGPSSLPPKVGFTGFSLENLVAAGLLLRRQLCFQFLKPRF
jgi:hypothetical protein